MACYSGLGVPADQLINLLFLQNFKIEINFFEDRLCFFAVVTFLPLPYIFFIYL